VLEEPQYAAAPVVSDPVAAGYENVLARIRKAMRSEDFSNAETLLTQAAARQNTDSAEYFNLLGILYEVQGKWRLARKCYGKALRADANYEPAQINMRRIYELTSIGKTSQVVVLGDESHAEVLAQLAKAEIAMTHHKR
jgi:Flp pilus assembly protein TadD